MLENLKKGLILCAEQKEKEGQDVLHNLKDVYECGDFSISTIEQGVECEFQWLLCQQYTVQNIRLEDAWTKLNDERIHFTDNPAMHSASNEYSGENVLHVLIVQGGSAQAHISRLFQMVTLQRYKMSLLCAEVSKLPATRTPFLDHVLQVSSRFFCPVYGGGVIRFGRTPFHFAVCTGQAAIVQQLLRQCKNSKQRYFHLWTRDSMGNTVLHMCVLNNLQQMYDILVSCMEDLQRELQNSQWWHSKKRLSLDNDDNLKNYDGYTVSLLTIR